MPFSISWILWGLWSGVCKSRLLVRGLWATEQTLLAKIGQPHPSSLSLWSRNLLGDQEDVKNDPSPWVILTFSSNHQKWHFFDRFSFLSGRWIYENWMLRHLLVLSSNIERKVAGGMCHLLLHTRCEDHQKKISTAKKFFDRKNISDRKKILDR